MAPSAKVTRRMQNITEHKKPGFALNVYGTASRPKATPLVSKKSKFPKISKNDQKMEITYHF
jgi:hypothetical protein